MLELMGIALVPIGIGLADRRALGFGTAEKVPALADLEGKIENPDIEVAALDLMFAGNLPGTAAGSDPLTVAPAVM